MADFHMHTLLIEDVIKTLNIDILLDIAKIGAQGPDMFYFNVRSKHHVTSFELANQMHNEKINQQLIFLVDYVKANQNQVLKSFLMGYLTHYVLDTVIHPYIFYYSGKYDPIDPKSHIYRGMHLKFERRVDIQFLKHVKRVPLKKYRLCDISYPIDDIDDMILQMMSQMVSEVYHLESADRFYKDGFQTIKKVCKHFVYDVYGVKKVFLSLMDFFNKHQPIFYKDLSYHNNDSTFDYLNLNHKPWFHPVTNQKHQSSVIDLYQKAHKISQSTIKDVFNYLNGDHSIELSQTFKNLSFDTGIDIKHDQTMKHFHLFTKK